MARKNRLVVQDGFYHVTACVAHQERLLRNPAFKAQIVDWIYDITDFSGVEVCAWNIMDNHLHLFLSEAVNLTGLSNESETSDSRIIRSWFAR